MPSFSAVYILEGNKMAENQIKHVMSYLYLKMELRKIAKEKNLTDEQIAQIEEDLKLKLEIPQNLCWI